jgi:hypothetical protein
MSRYLNPGFRLSWHSGLLNRSDVFFLFRGNHQFKANLSSTFSALRELLLRLEAGLVGQAMFGVQDFIDPRTGDRLTRFVNFLAGIGSHALD